MIPSDRAVREAQERMNRVRELSTRLDNYMTMLAHYRELAEKSPERREDHYRKVNWIVGELPGKLMEFEEARSRMQQSMENLAPSSSRRPPAISIPGPKTYKTPETRPYLQRIEAPQEKVV